MMQESEALARLAEAGIVGSDASTALAAYQRKGPLPYGESRTEALLHFGHDSIRVWSALGGQRVWDR